MANNSYNDAVLYLSDGTKFYGKSTGLEGITGGEICFNTGMTGYQEVFSDPSYLGQIMVTTNAHIGNYGVHDNELESESLKIAGLVCKKFSSNFSRPASRESLYENFMRDNMVGICDVDTRAVVRHIRHKGAMNAIICTIPNMSDEQLQAELEKVPNMAGLELASRVSTKEMFEWKVNDDAPTIGVLDYGVKKNILRCLSERGVNLKVFPYNTSVATLKEHNLDGILLSNGPGDPEVMHNEIAVVKEIAELGLPVFGICLGHQLLALSQGLKTEKMFNGHRGINHPIKNLLTGKGEITSQNHGFVVSESSIADNSNIELTHRHLNDDTVAGIRLKDRNIFSVQYHPEAGPGPHDSRYLFDKFIASLNA